MVYFFLKKLSNLFIPLVLAFARDFTPFDVVCFAAFACATAVCFC
jgi:hypothetical protein